MSEVLEGRIAAYDRGIITIQADYPNTKRFVRERPQKVRIELVDSRDLSDKQRRMCYALIAAIADWSGTERPLMKEQLKLDFIQSNIDRIADGLFSLSNAPMSLVRAFQKHLIELILAYDVPVKKPLYEYVDDIEEYVYLCLVRKKCAVCGRIAELHHVDAIGMGRDRREIVHEGMRVMSLCRQHHMEAHQMGVKDFMAKYHFNGGVPADKTICKIYKLKEKEK